jgi:magnesium-transporting ATPase (P-type)
MAPWQQGSFPIVVGRRFGSSQVCNEERSQGLWIYLPYFPLTFWQLFLCSRHNSRVRIAMICPTKQPPPPQQQIQPSARNTTGNLSTMMIMRFVFVVLLSFLAMTTMTFAIVQHNNHSNNHILKNVDAPSQQLLVHDDNTILGSAANSRKPICS